MTLFDPVFVREGTAFTDLDFVESNDPARCLARHSGHFALHARDADGSHVLARDLLGVHKLFFALGGGRVASSNFLIELLDAGHRFENVFSVPAGHYVRVHVRERRYELVRWGSLRFGADSAGSEPHTALAEHAAVIRDELQHTFRSLAQRFAGRPVYVTLSGGLDSTGIAVLAREVFPQLRAITFALRDAREAETGADLRFARRVAADLDLEHVEVLSGEDEVLELLDDVLIYGQDYRDFNVQCGLVNAAVGRAIEARHTSGPRPVVLSGDTMNELLADYAPVSFQGHEYFDLPRLERGPLRRFLVGGLDSGDREVGIFERFGVETVQPYALCAQAYAALSTDLACDIGSKARLVQAILGDRLPHYVAARPKVRAQVAVAGEPGGTLALLARHGIDQAALKARFATRFGIRPEAAGALTRAGHYRFSTHFPAVRDAS